MSFYAPLFSVDVEHAFWERQATALTCMPTPETADWIRRRDLLVRPQRNGVAIFCEAARRSILLDDCTPGTALLTFKWYARDPLFSQYTLPLVSSQEKILYARSGAAVTAESGDNRLCLHANEFVDIELMHAMTEPQVARHLDPRDVLRKPVLVVEIDLADHVAAKAKAKTNEKNDEGNQAGADANAGVDYYLRFSVRKSVWKYYFISDVGADAENLIVVDLDETVRFIAAAPEVLPGNRRALVFMSDGEIDMQQKYPQRFQLREQGGMGERVVIRRLPNADVSKVTQEMIGSRAALVSEIYIN
ncbi:hypothetical protein [Herbaspirillum rhizosphaerae]|uniref:hypothetical protein n=1 Tax=Herbaspirillum rhizosphaerae TaxID=346179 RepID=UPI00067B6D0B|nr:hypothetical protein [Herbaspirillum rhizosphaerae]